jgi:hypothetical protein
MKRLIVAFVLMSLSICSAIVTTSAQTGQGSGVISGSVRNADTSTAVAGAVVILTPNASFPDAGELARSATDSSGRFTFASLPLGTYRLFVRAAGFASGVNGAQDAISLGMPISLAADQRLIGLVFSLVPVGTITGEVQTHDGLPAVRVPVKVSRSLFTPTGRIQWTVKTTTTDVRGRFRLNGLNPARYFLSAGSEKPPSARTVEAAATENYAVQFYPGVETLEQAIPIDVTSGGELNVTLKIGRQKSVTIRGIIVDVQTGKPPDSVQWQLIEHPENGNNDSYVPPATYDAHTGEFELSNVWLGVYMLEARTPFKDSPSVDAGTEAGAMSPVARTRIVVQDSGLENLRLFQIRPFEVSGSVRVDGASEPPVLSGTVEALPIDPQSAGRRPPPARVAPDGSFKIAGLVPGEYQLRLQDRPATRSYIRNITYEGNDILNFPWQLQEAGNGTIEIVRRSGSARLTGTAINARSEPVPARVVLLPEARFRSDLYRSVVADRNGRFMLSDIEPGEYRLFAFEVLESGAEFDPEFMKSYELQGSSVHIAESITNIMDIRSVPRP